MNLIDEAKFILEESTRGQHVLGAFSGGKDSIVIKHLCHMFAIPVEWHYHKTTIDPPEVVQYIKREHPEVVFDRPKHGNFFNRVKQKKVLPCRSMRWCCDEYKEVRGPLNCIWIMGVRREESPGRKNSPAIGLNRRSRRVNVFPIVNWDSEFLWDFIRGESLSYPSVYDEGFNRVGCIGCPLVGRPQREKEFARWPKYGRKWEEVIRFVYQAKRWQKFPTFEEFRDAHLRGVI